MERMKRAPVCAGGAALVEPAGRVVPHPSERLLAVAAQLFCREGIHATGVDRILAEAGVAKATLYRNFGSKEKLIAAVLRYEGEQWRHWFFDVLDERGVGGRDALLAMFDILGVWFRMDTYYGCAFINAVGEHDKTDPAVRALALEHKRAILQRIQAEAEAAGATDAALLTHWIALLIDGAIVTAMITRDGTCATLAKDAASVLIDRMCPTSQS